MKTISIHDDRKTVEDFIKGLSPCENEFIPFVNSATQAEWVGRLFMNYNWLHHKGVEIPEIETIAPIQYSEFFVWLLETYCLGKAVDSAVQAVINLHKRRIEKEEIIQDEWAAVSAAASAAAISAASSAARAATRDAASSAARAAASSAAGAAASSAARAATRAAVRYATRDAAWYAAMAAASAAAMAAASAAAINKMGQIILEGK